MSLLGYLSAFPLFGSHFFDALLVGTHMDVSTQRRQQQLGDGSAGMGVNGEDGMGASVFRRLYGAIPIVICPCIAYISITRCRFRGSAPSVSGS